MEIDEETLSIMRSYCGGDPRERKLVTREVFSVYGSCEWSLADFQMVISDVAAKIPPERMPTALVSLEGGYDESTELKITYEDLSSDEEVATRTARAYEYARERIDSERRTFERLKAKYDPR